MEVAGGSRGKASESGLDLYLTECLSISSSSETDDELVGEGGAASRGGGEGICFEIIAGSLTFGRG